MQQDQFPYLRNIPIQYQKHLGGYMGGGSWEIQTAVDSNGDKAKIIVSRGTSYRSHGDIVRFQILEPNLEILQNQWIFFRGIKRFPDKWRRNNNFGYNSVLTAHFEQPIEESEYGMLNNVDMSTLFVIRDLIVMYLSDIEGNYVLDPALKTFVFLEKEL